MMGDVFMVVLIFLMISYAFWDELFTNQKERRPKASPKCSRSFLFYMTRRAPM